MYSQPKLTGLMQLTDFNKNGYRSVDFTEIKIWHHQNTPSTNRLCSIAHNADFKG